MFQLPLPCRLLVLGVFALAALVMALSLSSVTVRTTDARDAAALLGAAVVTAALSRRLDGLQRDDPRFITTDSCWLIPVALLLPLPMVAPVAFVLNASVNGLQRRGRLSFKRWFTFALVALATTAASATARAVLPALDDTGGLSLALGLCAVVVVYLAVTTLVVVAAWSSDPAMTWREARNEPILDAVELALTCFGALLALLLEQSLALLLLAAPVPLITHRLTGMGLLWRQADCDSKTGLLNSVAWTMAAERTVARHRSAGTPCAVLLIDLDHFKAVNDSYGHLVGDEVLIAASAALRRQLRPDCALARFGGEEFVVLLPHTDAGAAAVVAERLRQALREEEVHSGTRRVRITASIGVAATAPLWDVSELLAAADAAMYEAKRNGRDQVCVAGPSAVPA